MLCIIIGLGISYSAMHWNFFEPYNGSIIKNIEFQLSITNAELTDRPDFQSRILYPNIVKLIYFIVKKPFWTMFLAEAIVSIFSLYAFFLLSQKIVLDCRYSLVSVIALSIFTPYGFQLVHRFGELLLIGFNAILLYCILVNKLSYYTFFLIITSLQRPDIAISSIFFKMFHTIFVEKKYINLFRDISFLLIPVCIYLYIYKFYSLNSHEFYLIFIAALKQKVLWNIHVSKYLLVMYFPIIFLSIFFLRFFDKTIKLIFIASMPYCIFVFFLGNYAESRLLLPFFSILIIGIIKVVKDKKIFEIAR